MTQLCQTELILNSIKLISIEILFVTDFLNLSGFNFGAPQSNGLGLQPNQEGRAQSNATTSGTAGGSDILDSNSHELQLEKSNILLLGPTGSGTS